MKCLLKRALDESEFLSPYGSAPSKVHEREPCVFAVDGTHHGLVRTRRVGVELGGTELARPDLFPLNYR